jgi:hypothetical protein
MRQMRMPAAEPRCYSFTPSADHRDDLRHSARGWNGLSGALGELVRSGVEPGGRSAGVSSLGGASLPSGLLAMTMHLPVDVRIFYKTGTAI